MAKKPSKKATEEQSQQEVQTSGIEITGATIKDGQCNYSYVIQDGPTAGDTVSRKGEGLVDDDLIDAFRKLNVHMACIDDCFKNSGVEIPTISKMDNHEIAVKYNVAAFKMSGTEEEPYVILTGDREINCTSGRMELKTPKIPLDKFSSYEWKSQLKKAIENIKEEVILYMEGKCTKIELEEEPKGKQATILDGVEDDNLESGRV